jgi:hypothetical protein
MHRTLKGAAAAALMAASLGVADEAHAIEEAHMWGVGVRAGTIAVPGRFPLSFPTKIANYNFIDEGARAGNENGDEPNRDLDANGDPIYSGLERVRWDGQFALDAFYGIDAENRIGAMTGFATGRGYNDLFFMVNYDRVLVTESDIDIVAGLYAGFGQMRFKAPDGVEVLRVPHFPVRGHVMAQLRAKKTAYALGIFAGTNVPSNHYYTDVEGTERDDVGSPFNFALYAHAGLELSFQYGDFTPPKKKKKGKKGKKGKK